MNRHWTHSPGVLLRPGLPKLGEWGANPTPGGMLSRSGPGRDVVAAGQARAPPPCTPMAGATHGALTSNLQTQEQRARPSAIAPGA